MVALTLAAANTVELLQTIINIPRLGTVRPTELDIAYGVTDDPSSALWEVFLADMDPEALPDVSALRQRSLWQRVQNWRDQGGAAAGNPIQTMSEGVFDFWNGQSYVQRAAEFHAQRTIAFAAISQLTDTIRIQGTIFWEEILVQRVWGDDNAFSDLSFEDYQDDDDS